MSTGPIAREAKVECTRPTVPMVLPCTPFFLTKLRVGAAHKEPQARPAPVPQLRPQCRRFRGTQDCPGGATQPRWRLTSGRGTASASRRAPTTHQRQVPPAQVPRDHLFPLCRTLQQGHLRGRQRDQTDSCPRHSGGAPSAAEGVMAKAGQGGFGKVTQALCHHERHHQQRLCQPTFCVHQRFSC